MKAYYYVDSNGNEVLHLLKVFFVKNPKYGEKKVLLYPDQLDVKYRIHKKLEKIIEKHLIASPDIGPRIINSIVSLCFNNELEKAKNYVLGIFDNVVKDYEKIKKDKKDYDSKIDYSSYLKNNNIFDNYNGLILDKQDYDDYWWLRGDDLDGNKI